MSVCHSCFLCPDQTVLAATEAVPVPGPTRSGTGDHVGCVWCRSCECQGQWLGGGTAPDALPKCSPAEARGSWREGGKGKNHGSLPAHLKLFRAVLCWDLGTEPFMLNQWKAHDWFCKKMKLKDCLLFLEVDVYPGSFIHGLRIRVKHESQFKQHCSWRSWLSGLRAVPFKEWVFTWA